MADQPYWTPQQLMHVGRYVLDADGEPRPEPDLNVWADWMQTADRTLALNVLDDGTRVSTIFLGLDHASPFIGAPILWETMVFGGPHDQFQKRYYTKDDAILGHSQALELALGLTSE